MQLQHRCSTTPQRLGLVHVLRPRRRRQGGKDILATCLHLYDVDIKDGKCCMLNLPQPRLPGLYHHLQSLTSLHLRFQNGHVNFEHTSTSSWRSRRQQDIDSILRLSVLLKHIRTSKMNVHYLLVLQRVEATMSLIRKHSRSLRTSKHNKYFRMLLQQEYVEQVNFLDTSSCT